MQKPGEKMKLSDLSLWLEHFKECEDGKEQTSFFLSAVKTAIFC